MMRAHPGDSVEVREFDGEGCGIQCFRFQEYSDGPMDFRIEALPNHGYITYRASVNGEWIASVVTTDSPVLENCYSFIEDIHGGPPAVHLRYRDVATTTLDVQMRIHRTAPGTFYVACGFSRGYLGIRDDGHEGRQRILFSIWNPGSVCRVENRIAPERKKHLARCLVSREASFRPYADGWPIRAAKFTATGPGNVCAQVESPWFVLATGGDRVRPTGWPVGEVREL